MVCGHCVCVLVRGPLDTPTLHDIPSPPLCIHCPRLPTGVRHLRVLLRPPAFLLWVLGVRGRFWRSEILERLLRIITLLRLTRSLPPHHRRRNIDPLSQATHGSVLEVRAQIHICRGSLDPHPWRDGDHTPRAPPSDSDRDLSLPSLPLGITHPTVRSVCRRPLSRVAEENRHGDLFPGGVRRALLVLFLSGPPRSLAGSTCCNPSTPLPSTARTRTRAGRRRRPERNRRRHVRLEDDLVGLPHRGAARPVGGADRSAVPGPRPARRR